MTLIEAAAFLRCDEDTLEQRVLAGEIFFIDVDPQILFLREDLLEYLRSRRTRNEFSASVKGPKRPVAAPIVEGQIAFDSAQVSAITNIPYGTVLADIRAGVLVARKTGTKYYVHRDRLDEYLKCPAPKSQHASMSDPTPASGSSGTAATASERAALEIATSQLRKRSSRIT